MAPKSVQIAPEAPAGDPKHAARATRSAGRQMRSRLLDVRQPACSRSGAWPAPRFRTSRRPRTRFRARSPITSAPRKRCSSKPPAATCCMWRARPSRRRLQAADAAGIHPRAGRDGHGDGFGRLLCRSADADAPPPGSRTAGRTHHRAAARRGHARLCRPGRTARLAHASRDPDESSRRFWAVAIGVMVEGHAMGRSAEEMCSRDAARAGRSGDDKDRRRQRPAASGRRPRRIRFNTSDGERSS